MIDNLYKLLPYWFKGNGGKDSTTKDLLDSFEEQLNVLREKIHCMYDNTRVSSFKNIDYKCKKIIRTSFKVILKNYEAIDLAKDEKDFVKSIEDKKTKYLFDALHGIIYISNCSEHDVVSIDNEKVNLLNHRIWNADIIDEIGLKLDMPRLDGESNISYCDRLMSYSKVQGSSSLHGISSYVGHKLGVYKNIEWLDSSCDISIKEDRGIICRNILVNGEPFECELKNNIAYLKARDDFNGSKVVTYFYGFDIYNISEDNLDAHIIKHITDECPITYGNAKWSDIFFIDDEAYGEYIKLYSTMDDDLLWVK